MGIIECLAGFGLCVPWLFLVASEKWLGTHFWSLCSWGKWSTVNGKPNTCRHWRCCPQSFFDYRILPSLPHTRTQTPTPDWVLNPLHSPALFNILTPEAWLEFKHDAVKRASSSPALRLWTFCTLCVMIKKNKHWQCESLTNLNLL